MKGITLVRVIAVLLLVLPMTNAFATPASAKSVRELMTLTGSGKIGVQVMRNMMPALKRMLPKVPDSFWTEFMKSVHPEDLTALIVPIYQEHFTEEDIQNTIKFYKSPTGKKVIRMLPVIMQESMQVGQQWGQKLAQQAYEKAKKENLIKEHQAGSGK